MTLKNQDLINPFNKNLNLDSDKIKNILSASRQRFFKGKNKNLDYLLNKRYKWIAKEIMGSKNVLEIGSGSGISKLLIKKKFVTSDIIKNDWIDHSFNAEKIPFPNNSFDCVFICQTILHFNDPVKFFSEVERILKYGGRFVIHDVNLSYFHKMIMRVLGHCDYSYDVDLYKQKNNLNSSAFSSNAANLELVIDHESFTNKYKSLRRVYDKKDEFLIYLLSGGVNTQYKFFQFPQLLLRCVDIFDDLIQSFFPNIFSLSRKVIFEKNSKIDISKQLISGWGERRKHSTFTYYPDKISELKKNVRYLKIFSGNFKSYGDVSRSINGITGVSKKFDKIKKVDFNKNEIICESGVLLSQINSRITSKNFVLFVSPGYEDITVGGAIANDVHGKNYCKHSSFGTHLNWIELVTKQGNLIRADRKKNKDLFFATIGGIGLTGVITQASISIKKIASQHLICKNKIHTSITNLLNDLKNKSFKNDFAYGVIINNPIGNLKGLVKSANLQERKIKHNSLDASLLKNTLFGLATKFSNKKMYSLYYYVVFIFIKNSKSIYYEHINKFNYQYNNNLVNLSCLQLQYIIPELATKKVFNKIQKLISNLGSYSYLVTVKYFNKKSGRYLSFPKRGYTFTFDFKNNEKNREIIKKIIPIITQYKGRVYLAKDNILDKQNFTKMYNKNNFLKVVKKYNKENFISSASNRYDLN